MANRLKLHAAQLALVHSACPSPTTEPGWPSATHTALGRPTRLRRLSVARGRFQCSVHVHGDHRGMTGDEQRQPGQQCGVHRRVPCPAAHPPDKRTRPTCTKNWEWLKEAAHQHTRASAAAVVDGVV
jgi:hypothetical protein